jgi:YVTN family beta-propeller protein
MGDTIRQARDTARPSRPRYLTRELLKLLAALVAFALIGAILVILLRDSGDESGARAPAATPAPSTAVPRGTPIALGAIGATIAVGAGGELQLAAGAGAIWVANRSDGTVSRIDPATNAVVAVIQVGDASRSPDQPRLSDITVGEAYVWVARAAERRVAKIDPATNTVVADIRVSGAPSYIAAGAGAVWVSSPTFQKIDRIDPQTHQRTQIYSGVPLGTIAVGESGVWVAATAPGALLHISPATRRIDMTIPIAGAVSGIVVDAGGAWVRVTAGVRRVNLVGGIASALIDTEAGSIFGIGRHGMAGGAGVLWTTGDLAEGSELLAVDTAARAIVARLGLSTAAGVSQHPNALAFTDTAVWVATNDGSVIRVDPTR